MFLRAFLGLLGLLGPLVWGQEGLVATIGQADQALDLDRMLADIRYLADDDREGRAAGSEGDREAAQYVIQQLQAAGVGAGPGLEGYNQPFELQVHADWTLVSESRLVFRRGEKEISFVPGRDFKPLDSSPNGLASGPVALAGYGVDSPLRVRNDFADLDCRGKVLLMLRHEPRQKRSEHSFSDGSAWTAPGWFETKIRLAAARGARALILINHPRGGRDRLRLGLGTADPRVQIPVLQMKARAGRRLFGVLGLDLKEVARTLDQSDESVSQDLAGVTVELESRIQTHSIQTQNVIARIPGTDSEAVVIGAHLDHVGRNFYPTRSKKTQPEAIHNGADDNASGVAVLLEIARVLTEVKFRPRREILFVFFGAEERGLYGSRHFVDHPIVPLNQVAAMINLDMVGRGTEGHFIVRGVRTAPDFESMVRQIASTLRADEGTGYHLRLLGTGLTATDNTPFYRAGIPILNLTTGKHPDYHKPGDDWRKINRVQLRQVTRFTLRALTELAALRAEKPEFQSTDLGFVCSSAKGEDIVLGLILESGTETSEGETLRVETVLPGLAGDAAGLRVDDQITAVDGHVVARAEDVASVLAAYPIGQQVTFSIQREGDALSVSVGLAGIR